MAMALEEEIKALDINKVSYLESFIKPKSRPSDKSPNVYIPLCRTTFDNEFWLKKVEVGRKDKSKREKVIMMVGATGSGKTTTINAMLNYIMGVEFEDQFRLRLIEEEDAEDQTKSVTKCITAYTIHHQPGFKVDYTVTIIDTPGFGDTCGITRNKEILGQIKEVFSTKGFDGIDILHAVGFMVPSYPARLTPTQSYIFDSLVSVFGKDIKDNIFMFRTFASHLKSRLLDTIHAAKFPHSGYFKFNHKGLYCLDCSDSDKEEIKSLQASWDMGRATFRNFFNHLNLVEPKSLQMTKKDLLEKCVLEDTLENTQDNIMLGINELEKLNKEKEVLKKYEQDMDSKKHIEYQVNEQFTELTDVPDGFAAINCKTCNVTCLKTRYPWKNSNLEDCWLFQVSRKAAIKGCHKCPSECEWNMHKCEEKYYVIKTKRITKTLGELQESYKDTEGRKMMAAQIIKELQERIDEVGHEAVRLIEKARRCIERLDKIALKLDPLSTDDYIDLMIEDEKAKVGDELTKRIQTLIQLKERQEVRRNIVMGAAISQTAAISFEAKHTDTAINHKQHFIENHCQLRSSEPINVYAPVLKPTYEDQRNLIRTFDIGTRNMSVPEKVILLVGGTGSGKTALINALFNYIFGVKWEDSFRLKLTEEQVSDQAESITKFISSYTIQHQQGFDVPYTITVIDTPGFGDTLKRDQEITKQIKTFFSTAGVNGMRKLDAVAFVAVAPLNRISPTQAYVFESTLALFGKDVENCLMLFLTFADRQKPRILRCFREMRISFRKYFKFNNFSLYKNNEGEHSENSDSEHSDSEHSDFDDDEDPVMEKFFWNVGEKSFKSFITELAEIEPLSLVQTKEVLDERMKLDKIIEVIQKKVNSVQDIKPRYNEAKGGKFASKQTVNMERLSLTDAARKSILRLNEIALRPDPVIKVDYIDLLIKDEEMRGKPFWEDRVNQLHLVRNQALCLMQIAKQNLDPFEVSRRKIVEVRKESGRGVWTRLAEYLEQDCGTKQSMGTKPDPLQIHTGKITDSKHHKDGTSEDTYSFQLSVSNSSHQDATARLTRQLTADKSYLQIQDPKDERFKHRTGHFKKGTEHKIKSDSSFRGSDEDTATKASNHDEFQQSKHASKLGTKSSSDTLPPGHEKTLSELHLLEISKRISSESERMGVGMHLGLKYVDIMAIKYNYPNDFIMANHAMLQKWFVTTPDSQTAMNELETALRKCKLNQIVTSVLFTDE